MNVALLYLSHLGYGGWLSYTVHMQRAFEQAGHNTKLFKIGNNTESKERPYGYGVNYRNISRETLEDVYDAADIVIITALGKKLYDVLPLLKAQTILVVHDHTEITPELLEHIDRFKIVAIRDAPNKLINSKGVPSVFIQHPYSAPLYTGPAKRQGAVSISRLDFDKRTTMICQANEKVVLRRRVRIYGEPGNLWARAMKGKGFDWKPYWFGRFERSFSAMQEILHSANYCIDLSIIKGDGGGSQYSFLEAWDAKTALVVHRKWLETKGELVEGRDCYAVESAEELADFLKHDHESSIIVENAYNLLKKHQGKDVVKKFMEIS